MFEKDIRTVRKGSLAALLIGMTMALSGCFNQEKVAELEAQNQQLQQELQEMDSSITNYLGVIGDIEDNLAVIKEKENWIHASTSDNEVEFGKDFEVSVVEDLQMINALMDENRAKLAKLQKSLSNRNSRIRELNKLVDRLNAKLIAKEESIAKLNTQLEELGSRNAVLAESLQQLNLRVDTLELANNIKLAKLEIQAEQLQDLKDQNTAYYALGTSKELSSKQIITKKGGILGIGAVEKLNEQLSAENFYQIDIRQTTTIPLMARKAELVSPHPQGSYEIEKDAKLITSLIIKDPDIFWNYSKYLVVKVN